MKRDLFLAGLVGWLIGGAIYFLVSWVTKYFSNLIYDQMGVTLVFAALGLIALIEIPMMIFGVQRMARGNMARSILAATFGFYVSFAFVYADVFIFLTGDQTLGNVLAALSLARWISGGWIK
ncbi:MAG: hypothetical protein HY070_10300 [Chloroflexi bacterium]|nr:hypothetical protein [Chloroflexota bacterium]